MVGKEHGRPCVRTSKELLLLSFLLPLRVPACSQSEDTSRDLGLNWTDLIWLISGLLY